MHAAFPADSNFMRLNVLLVAFALVGTGLRAASVNPVPEQVLPELHSLLQQSLNRSPRMVNRALDLEMAEQTRIAARAAILPHVSGMYSVVEARDQRRDLASEVSATKTYYNLGVRQPVYHWGERRNTARIGAISQQIAEQNYAEAYRQLGQEVRQRYLGLIAQKRLLERARRHLASLEQQLKFAEERFREGAYSGLQLTQASNAAEQGRLSFDRAELEFDLARQGLARLTGGEPLAESAIPDAVPAPEFDLRAVEVRLADFLGARELPSAELVNLQRQLEIERLNYANQRTRLRPKVDLSAGLTQDEQAYSFNVGQKYGVQSIYAGLSVSWTLFDGFSAQAGTRQALARRRQLENDYEETRGRLAQHAQLQVRQLQLSARSLAIAERTLTNTHEMLDVTRAETVAGRRTEAEVAQAELALIDAQVQAFQARSDLMLKLADFLGTVNADPVLQTLRTP